MPLISPLFAEAARKIQKTANSQFAQTQIGKMVNEVGRLSRASRQTSERIQSALRRYASTARPEEVIQSMMGSDFGQVVRTVAHYARGGSTQERMVFDFLRQLGPAGKMIEALIMPGKTAVLSRELQAAANLIRAFGGEVLPGRDWGTVEDVQRGLKAAQRRLEEYGFQLSTTQGPPRRYPEPEPGRKTIDVPMGLGRKTGRVAADHPMLTGEMVRCPNSTNVYEFGYDHESATLYVRFQASHGKNEVGGAGSLYAYSGVTPEEFLFFYSTRNGGGGSGGDGTPGTWVWDHLRIRGTVSGHQKDYSLVGVMNNYVPRKATVRPTYETTGKRGQLLKRPRKTGVEEWYVQRTVKTHQGRFVQSVLPTVRVLPPRTGG